MDIKEIALNVADSMSNTTIIMPKNEDLIAFAEAIIESYKAELLKEVGEPVAYMCSDEELCRKGYERFSRHNSGDWSISVFTSDQVAAAIEKATKPLEDEVKAANSECELFRKNGRIVDANKIVELSTQLAAAQEANEHWQRATAENENKWIEANDKLAKAEQRVAEYNELIYAVQTKNPDETRHQTALRYIRNAENRPSNTAANGASS